MRYDEYGPSTHRLATQVFDDNVAEVRRDSRDDVLEALGRGNETGRHVAIARVEPVAARVTVG